MHKTWLTVATACCVAYAGLGQNVGIGTVQPKARLQVADSSVLFTAVDIVSYSGLSPLETGGIGMLWYAPKAAFRVGIASGNDWSNQNTGKYSAVIGSSSKAKGLASIVIGHDNLGDADLSFTIGYSNQNFGNNSLVLGKNCVGYANSAMTLGVGLISSSMEGTVLGRFNVPIGVYDQDITTNPILTVGNGINSSFRSNALVVLKNGNIGINENFPEARLSVQGTVRLSGIGHAAGKVLVSDAAGYASWQNPPKIVLDQALATSTTSLEFLTGSTYRGALGYDGNAGRFFFYEGESSTNVMFINNGRVGLKRDPVSNVLEVNGEASKATAGSWLGNSDARLKKNIEPINDALDKLMQLKGITYEWNDEKNGYQRPTGKLLGFTAQNIQQVFPEKVIPDANGYLQTAYGDYDPLFVEAIRELKLQLDLLQDKVQHLEKENKRLKAKTGE